MVSRAHLADNRSAIPEQWTAAPSPAPHPARATVAADQLAADGMLVWTKHSIDAALGGDQVLQLAIYTVRPQAGPGLVDTLADVLVFPGLNGLPRQVAGLDPADYPDRSIGLRLAQAGFAAHIVDYAPGTPDLQRATGIQALAVRLAQASLLAGPAIAETAAWWLNTSPDCTSGRRVVLGHSVGAYLGALAAREVSGSCDVILASGVVPLAWLHSTPGMASPLHQLPPDCLPSTSFGGLLNQPGGGRVQVQYGTADQTFDQAALRAGAAEVAQLLGPRANICALAMGHGTDAPAAIAFLNEGLQL